VALLGGALALALLAGGWLWLRSSPLSSVRHVRIVGVRGPDAARVDSALRTAARGMSTLNVNPAALRAAVAPLHLVRALSVSPSFPHGLRIAVVEQLPVAQLDAAGGHTAVAADGVVLGPALLGTGALPTLQLSGPAPVPGRHVLAPGARAALAVLGAVPRVLLAWVQRVYAGAEGLTVQMRDGLLLYFGNATRPHAKWLAAARVLADPTSAGATYIDVRLPERPAAGFGSSAQGASPGGSATESGSAAGGVGASDPNTASLAAKLDEAVSGGSSANAAATTGTVTPASSAGTATGAGANAGAGAEGGAAGGAGANAGAEGAAAGGAGAGEASADTGAAATTAGTRPEPGEASAATSTQQPGASGAAAPSGEAPPGGGG
jgi:cell division protein FtsQ